MDFELSFQDFVLFEDYFEVHESAEGCCWEGLQLYSDSQIILHQISKMSGQK